MEKRMVLSILTSSDMFDKSVLNSPIGYDRKYVLQLFPVPSQQPPPQKTRLRTTRAQIATEVRVMQHKMRVCGYCFADLVFQRLILCVEVGCVLHDIIALLTRARASFILTKSQGSCLFQQSRLLVKAEMCCTSSRLPTGTRTKIRKVSNQDNPVMNHVM
jgi:hypothetical protein